MATRCVAGARLAGWLLTAALLLSLLGRRLGAGGSVPALAAASSGLAQRVVWAVNAGGDAHTDAHGVRYGKDPLEGRTGVASDYGALRPIARSARRDQVLYQTERYSEHTFGYEVPLGDDGDGPYVLVMKFAEVYFGRPRQKVFDVRLNGHVVLKDLDIFERAGRSSAAHDEAVPFSLLRGQLRVRGEASAFGGKLTVEFVKGRHDNPKVCALYVMKGTLADVPKLPPQDGEEEEWGKEGGDGKSRYRRGSGHRIPNPYDDDDDYGSLLLPVLVALVVFAASLFFLRWL